MSSLVRRIWCFVFILQMYLELRVATSEPTQAEVILQKCCASHEILDEWQNCVYLPKYLQGRNAVAKTLIENICSEKAHFHPTSGWRVGSICSSQFQPSSIKFSHDPGTMNCAKRARVEMNVLDISVQNKTFLVQRPSSSTEAEVASLDIASTGCLDLALLPDGEVEGPFVQGQYCSFKFQY